MSRFSCPCGLEADVPADEMLTFVQDHQCAFHMAAQKPPKTAHEAWANVAGSLLMFAFLLGVCVICAWAGTHR